MGMKALDWRRDQHLMNSSLLAVEGAVVYMLISGRNAWHSTWITRYSKNIAFYSSLQGAKSQAELLRRQGSVFYVRQVPVLLVRTTEGAVVQAEFHSRTCFGKWDITAGSELLRIGTPTSRLLSGLGPDSELWRPPKISQYSFVTVVPEWDNIPPLPKGGAFRSWTSEGLGPKYQLAWRDGRQDYRRTGINAILRQFEATNSTQELAQALEAYRRGQQRRTEQRRARLQTVIDAMNDSLGWVEELSGGDPGSSVLARSSTTDDG